MKLKNMNIRAATTEDVEAIKNLVFGILNEYGLQPDSSSTDKDLDHLDNYYWANNGYFGVVEEDTCIVATVGLLKISNDTCELRKMYVLPSSRGKGLGKQILEFALAKALQLGYGEITLETATPLKEAIALYKKYGFAEFYPEHLSSRCDQAFKLALDSERL